ncbi:MAG: hypothetical protein KGQ86_11555, partial [Bacteroidetes bacterium]|nr:hypothetical protein [Bacteroidota bacterium]
MIQVHLVLNQDFEDYSGRLRFKFEGYCRGELHSPSHDTGAFSVSANYDVSLRKYIKMALKNLPLGMSTLSKLLENNCIYVDKTE